ncbi:Acidic fibroblast growth factor intracellular-binding protein [Phytophthora cinnamomi]|uniref:Acidic fibroblast growth factor intracellular-binding protein n=1 Tax=Phytophthora cinnamomi TaxID=4785 RepID=UPI00355A65A2|nr:Acidic fibroblast growth factor intracellular-binding protein [Phytophthora cinnamomi]
MSSHGNSRRGFFEEVGLARDIKRLRFDDFVLSVATIATWSKSELLHYAFKQFDVDDSGVMDSRELRAFCEGLKNDSSFYFAKNVNIAREKLAARDRKQQNQESSRQLNQNSSRQLNKAPSGQLQIDEANTLVDVEDLVKGSTEFQVAFYPLMQLQQNVRACALGEHFWAKVTVRRQQVEVIVKSMGLHSGKLPPISFWTRIVAYLIPFSQAHAKVLVHKLAVLKYAEEQRKRQEEAKARAEAKAQRLAQIEEV